MSGVSPRAVRASGLADSTSTAEQCPRIAPEFLAEERRALGDRYYRQEYACSFEDAIDALFSAADIARAFDCDEPPFFLGDDVTVSATGQTSLQ